MAIKTNSDAKTCGYTHTHNSMWSGLQEGPVRPDAELKLFHQPPTLGPGAMCVCVCVCVCVCAEEGLGDYFRTGGRARL